MLLSLLLRGGLSGGSGPDTIFDNGEPVPLPPRTKKLLEGISPLIQSQVPDFVNFDHPNFVAFIEAYYEWMEIQGNATERTLLLNDYRDIDRTIDQFIESFDETFMKNVPRVIDRDTSGNVINRETILKNMKDFYAVKGSEKSFEFFFRAFYDSVCEFYYPRVDILETSGGRWIEKKSIRVTSANGVSNYDMRGKTVTQTEGLSSTTGFIEDVVQYEQYPYLVTELFLTNVQGEFKAGIPVTVVIDSNTTLTETTFGLFDQFNLSVKGKNYRIGDDVKLLDADSSGVGARARVLRVDGQGAVEQIEILDHGVNYAEGLTFSIETETGDGSAVGVARSAALAVYDGFYFDDGGKPSSKKKIHDSDYYQRFSYVLKTNLSLKKYKDALLALIHPAGFKVFGDVLLADTMTSENPFHSQNETQELSMVGNYTPYTFDTTQNLRANNSTSGTSVDLYPKGFAPGFTGVSANGFIGSVYGNSVGTVPEDGITAHVVGTGLTGPLGGTGNAGGTPEGYSAAQSLNLNFFPIYHHPNSRGLNKIPSGNSFGGTNLRPFFFIPIGKHFHSNPTYSTWTSPQFPYLGSTADGGTHDEYYSVPYGTTSESPNP